ncbi:MAG: zinc-dependent peptidase [Cyclobacteriaceae bacterium]|nr:zinc-dependent peptidase [Cyclobacteriaceae bacterium]
MGAFIILLAVMVLGIGISIYRRTKQRKEENSIGTFPLAWKSILARKVDFYSHLTPENKSKFEDDIVRFLNNVRIEGVGTTVDITDRLLVASSAVIPVFGFPEWDYTFLDEVLLYPEAFDRNFSLGSKNEFITGMVGSGSMEGKMILSKPSLHLGFDNASDKQNVGIHEFIHLLDKEDGSIDGILPTFRGKQFTLPWLELIRKKTEEMLKGKNKDINGYGATDQREFLAVAGEYFFERPHLLQKNHPELYALLATAFNQHTINILKPGKTSRPQLERNKPCHCGSGKKYKNCCLDQS